MKAAAKGKFKVFFIVVLFFGAIVGLVFLLKDKLFAAPAFLPTSTGKKTTTGGSTSSAGTASADSVTTFPLVIGDQGDLIKMLQTYLNTAGSYGLTVDGIFGPKTQAAVVSELTGLPGITNPQQVPQWWFDEFVIPNTSA